MESPSSVKKRRFTIDGLAYLELDFLRLYWILGFWVRFIAAGTDLSAEGLCLGCERRQCGSLLCDSSLLVRVFFAPSNRSPDLAV
ncbi:uncharacterized protein LOC110872619 isoform X7 [Helianthus annuus]|uniref:uncharacterized protein LOC110872619 isoform X7 n=1 Tax=Helianthus annuus TaxID=4232 RepID=UPI000B9039B9|nr:uncharacterized protein LOC110872619 isoform X7 [Helianthus annuus]